MAAGRFTFAAPFSRLCSRSANAGSLNDLAHAAWANYEQGTHDLVYFAADRISNNGSAFLGFWFFKGNVTKNPTGTGFTGVHTVGDILVLANFVQGNGGSKISGASETVGVFEWVGIDGGGDIGSQHSLQTLVPIGSADCTSSIRP